jgi:hypothetical protein
LVGGIKNPDLRAGKQDTNKNGFAAPEVPGSLQTQTPIIFSPLALREFLPPGGIDKIIISNITKFVNILNLKEIRSAVTLAPITADLISKIYFPLVTTTSKVSPKP